MTVRSVLKNALNAIGSGLRAYWVSVVAHNKQKMQTRGFGSRSSDDQSHSRDTDYLIYEPAYSHLAENVYHHSNHGSSLDD